MSYIDLNWDYYKVRDNGEVELKGANFSGPGIKDSYKLLPKDSISLDFTNYYSKQNAIDSYYIVKFSWNGTRYDGTYFVYFKEAVFTNVNFNLFNRIKRKGYIRIFLDGHDEVEHYRNIFYKSEVLEY